MPDKLKIVSDRKDVSAFAAIPELRKQKFAEALPSPVSSNFAVNSVAALLHPSSQALVVSGVEEAGRDVRKYTLVPDETRGTASLAVFRPGQYLSFTLAIGQAVVSRPYTICSSPKAALEDRYEVLIRRHPNGFVSPYIFANWGVGTQVTASAPMGPYHQPIRDGKNVVAVCDTRGVSPFLSMAQAICDGSMDVHMTLLYACRKRADAVAVARLEELSAETDRFRVVYVFSDETVDGCERGFVTKNILEKYAPRTRYSVFICGSTALYNRLSEQLLAMRLERKYVRFGYNGQITDPSVIPGFPPEAVGQTYLCKVIRGGEQARIIHCRAQESVLTALEREGLAVPSSCRSGECGFCRARLTKGNVFMPRSVDSRRVADSAHGVIHPCCSYPMSDLTIVLD